MWVALQCNHHLMGAETTSALRMCRMTWNRYIHHVPVPGAPVDLVSLINACLGTCTCVSVVRQDWKAHQQIAICITVLLSGENIQEAGIVSTGLPPAERMPTGIDCIT